MSRTLFLFFDSYVLPLGGGEQSEEAESEAESEGKRNLSVTMSQCSIAFSSQRLLPAFFPALASKIQI